MEVHSGSSPVWVWCPAKTEAAEDFQHPSCIPTDEASVVACFTRDLRGPRIARISPATLLHTKGDIAFIAERGTTREVPKSMLVKWYEGLLLLEELEADRHSRKGEWFGSEL